MSIADKLTQIAENEKRVYEAGKKSKYDEFWDEYQENGDRTDYLCAFSGAGWTQKTFKPKYGMKPTSAYMMFRQNQTRADLKKLLDQAGLVLDFSNCTRLEYTFNSSHFTKIGLVDCRNATSTQNLFASCPFLESAEIEVSETTPFNAMFNNDAALKQLTVRGTIGQNGFNVSASKDLTHDSIVSIISALSTNTGGLTVTLSRTAVNKAFETSVGEADGSKSEAWLQLIATRSNWTISLV